MRHDHVDSDAVPDLESRDLSWEGWYWDAPAPAPVRDGVSSVRSWFPATTSVRGASLIEVSSSCSAVWYSTSVEHYWVTSPQWMALSTGPRLDRSRCSPCVSG
ncbi:Uu.00g067110.m01.CDS01 [Anthostomella pinea]|uniref:Uu.00g067110.m01.CDS01 n=1 Tax=Anthostomella pinea TaxID=933095 RepID=A0AAI8VU37_9PEZI|nr:Uu.00g067110.m01.CDS01 [Anthostomella pinea]